MSTYINILFTLFFLVPGFLALRIRQRTAEYRDLSAFEFTSVSIGYSFIIATIWLVINYILARVFPGEYIFFSQLRAIVVDKDLGILFSPFSGAFLVTYANAFGAFSLTLFAIHWMGLGKKVLQALGLRRFTSRLTPWEDFQILSQMDWVAVELTDGRTFLGKLGIGSHLPFDRELILKRVDKSPVTIYDANHELVELGEEIQYSYVSGSEIRAMHNLKDPEISAVGHPVRQYVLVMLLHILGVLFLSLALSLVVLNVGDYWRHSAAWDGGASVIAVVCVVFSLRSLRRFS